MAEFTCLDCGLTGAPAAEWDRWLLRRGYVIWHCYACSFKCSTTPAAVYHLRVVHKVPAEGEDVGD